VHAEKDEDEEFPIVKLCDFGLSLKIEEESGKAFMAESCGTMGY
jgi:serine/threonine protein kinase